jgi:nitroreductase
MIESNQRLALAAAANRAPSVHNIQPTRFRFDDARTIVLMEDPKRRLFVGDPRGSDNQKSLGAALEGLALALSEQGVGVELAAPAPGEAARLTLVSGAALDPLAQHADTRQSWRGAFAPRTDADHAALAKLAEACPDLRVIEAPDAIAPLAKLYDDVSVEVVRDKAYRAELVSWMRLSKSDPNYGRDGLNAEHMALSGFEAFAAGVVLGGAFPTLDSMGVAGPLMSEAGKVKSAAGIALFHRPADEPELDTGRRFHRVWLEVERLGLSLCPMSVLADVPHAAKRLLDEHSLAGRKLVTAFRVGRRPPNAKRTPRARLPAAELVV